MMTSSVPLIRLLNQQVLSQNFKTPKELVGWMGAMQAQDYQMVKWAVGVRLHNAADKNIESAVAKGDIIRTHLLRPTWHFVSPKDIYWMLELTAPNIFASMKSRHKQLEITDAVIKKSTAVIEKLLRDGNHCTREEIFDALEKAKTATKNQRGIHLVMCAELKGLICSGIPKGKEQTYALLEERAPKKNLLKKDEALAELAQRYFASHGPATVQDFTWWSGLSVADAKSALEMIKQKFISEKIGERIFWMNTSSKLPKKTTTAVHVLPAYDEFIISYKDRSDVLTSAHLRKTISDNGMFWPIIVIDGRVEGTWKRKVEKDRVRIEPMFFQSAPVKIKTLVEEAFQSYGKFLGLPADVRL